MNDYPDTSSEDREVSALSLPPHSMEAEQSDLGARTDGRPSIDHRAFVHIRADIDVRRHQNGVFADEAAAARHGTGYGAEAGGAEFFFAPV